MEETTDVVGRIRGLAALRAEANPPRITLQHPHASGTSLPAAVPQLPARPVVQEEEPVGAVSAFFTLDPQGFGHGRPPLRLFASSIVVPPYLPQVIR
jgi:hypothetical protein